MTSPSELLALAERFWARVDKTDSCPRGHPYDEQNTYQHKRGTQGAISRHCRTCWYARRRARHARAREEKR